MTTPLETEALDEDDEGLEARARGPAVAGRSDLRSRAWVLLAMDAAARHGLTPLSKLRFHRFAYLTNALSPVYSVHAADEQIVKFERGQFYPNLQWHLDRLMAEGLLRIGAIRHFRDEKGPWMDADYRLAKEALPVIARILELDEMRSLSGYLQELAKAYGSQDEEALDELALADRTYGDATRARGAVIDFSKSADNLSVQAANAFATHIRDPRYLGASDRIHLYVEYMDRLRDRAPPPCLSSILPSILDCRRRSLSAIWAKTPRRPRRRRLRSSKRSIGFASARSVLVRNWAREPSPSR